MKSTINHNFSIAIGSIGAFILGAASPYVYLQTNVLGHAVVPTSPIVTASTNITTVHTEPVLKGASTLAVAPVRSPAPPPLEDTSKRQMIGEYYDDINNGDLQSAYRLLSPAYHEYQTYDAFVSSYGAKSHIGVVGFRDWPGTPGIGVAIVDEENTVNGPTVNYLAGYFTFSYDQTAGWQIDERHLTTVASRNVGAPPESSVQDGNPDVIQTSGPSDSSTSNNPFEAATPSPDESPVPPVPQENRRINQRPALEVLPA